MSVLYLKYRPNSLDEIIGNEEIVQLLKEQLSKNSKQPIPHSLLFHGPTGCGKTTLGRIVAHELGAKGNDIREVDSADFRGIDTIRDIRKQSTYKPLEGPCRVWILDECFAKGTKIRMLDGMEKPIEEIQTGEQIQNFYKGGTVTHTFQNKVELDRVLRIMFSDGSSLVCSKEHLFLTASGWKKASDINIKNDFILSPSYNISRHSESITKISDRSGWGGSPTERAEAIRQEERGEINFVRVESIEVYERGNNDGSFHGIIEDKERDQGYVIFYDLEINSHPSYIANGKLVHNCHKLTGDAQTALLKALEDTPNHIYYILCTTEPQKLLPTIRGRCSQYQVQPLAEKNMKKLLRRVVKAEEESLSKEIYDQIVQDSFGHPRNALQILAQVLSVSEEDRMKVAKKTAETQSKTIELCRALTSGWDPWHKIATILKGLKDEDPEQIRRAILGYCQAILLGNTPSPFIAGIMEEFIEPFYNTGFPGLTLACYSALFTDEEDNPSF